MVEDAGRPGARSIYRHVNSGGSFGANPLRQTIGIGTAQVLDRLEIYWPTSDTTQVFEQVSVNQMIRIREGAAEFEAVNLPRFQFPSE